VHVRQVGDKLRGITASAAPVSDGSAPTDMYAMGIRN
jgi:hypothetical protein